MLFYICFYSASRCLTYLLKYDTIIMAIPPQNSANGVQKGTSMKALLHKANQLLHKAMYDQGGNINSVFWHIYICVCMFSAGFAGLAFFAYTEPHSSAIAHVLQSIGVMVAMFVVGVVVPFLALQLAEHLASDRYDRLRQQRNASAGT